MRASPILSLAPAVRLVEDKPADLAIEGPTLRLPVSSPASGLRATLQQLAAGGATEESLAQVVRELDGATGLLRFHHLLGELREGRALCLTLTRGGERLATCVPTSAPITARPPFPGRGRFLLSRFAYLRRHDESLIVESPLSHAYFVLHEAHSSLLFHALSNPLDAEMLVERIDALLPDEAEMALALLWGEGLLTAVHENGEVEEESDPQLQQWESHDLMFHARSRAGRHANPYGGTFPFVGRVEPEPALEPERSDDFVDLHRPDLDRLGREDRPFTQVVETRRSRRQRGATPIDLQQLGGFLYRSSRLRRVVDQETHQVSDRVYPGGGACYELEIYLAVDRCDGLESGFYHYGPDTHRLFRLGPETVETRALLVSAVRTARSDPPEVLMVLAARFRRVTWKYRSMAYAGILKDVGVLYQNMYLVATAMGLSGCALGGGDSDLFARAAGANYLTEGSVGEFTLNRGTGPGSPTT